MGPEKKPIGQEEFPLTLEPGEFDLDLDFDVPEEFPEKKKPEEHSEFIEERRKRKPDKDVPEDKR